MTLYHVLWDHWEGEPAAQLVEDDRKRGKVKEFGLFAGTGRGYAVFAVDSDVELLQLASKYRERGLRMLSVEPVIPLDQIGTLQGR